MSNTISVRVLGDVRDINKKMSTVTGQLGGFQKTAGRMGTALKAAFAGLVVGQAVNAIKDVVQTASDAQQSLGATETVFGKFASTVVSESKRAATQFGLDANTYRENANLLGALFSNQGVAAGKLAGATKQLIGVGSDLSATFGGTTTEAVEALSAAYKGEFDSLERYGISLKQSSVNAESAALAQKKYGKELSALTTEQQKAIQNEATTSLIMKQSSKSRGAFAKETNTLAHQQQVLSAQFSNLKATLGTALLPVITKVLTVINSNFVPAIEAIGSFLGPVIARVKEFFSTGSGGTSAFAPLVAFFRGQFIPAVQGVIQAFQGFLQVVIPIVMQVVNAIRANWSQIAPYVKQAFDSVKQIIVGVLGIIAQVTKVVTAVIKAVWKNFGGTILAFITTTFQNIAAFIGGIMRAIAGVVKVVLSVLKGDWKGAWNGIKQIVSGVWQAIKALVSQAVNVVKTVVSAAWQAVKAGTSAAWNGIKSAVSSAVQGLLGFIRGLPGQIRGVFAGAGSWLLSAGRSIIQGLLDGITGMIGSVKSKLGELTSMIPDWKGPRQKDKRLLTPAGRLIMKSLIKGFDDGRKGVKDVLGDITKQIAKTMDKRFKNDKKARSMTRKAIKSLKDETKALMKNAKKREQVYKKLEKAQKNLADLKKASKDYAQSVKESVLGYTDITNLNSAFNTDAMLEQLRARLDKVKQFAALIKQLVKGGLNQTMVDQLVQAGVEGGLATALAISQGGPEAIKDFNALQTEINSAATGLGKTAADNMYAAGIQAAEGLVKGLQARKKKLEKWATQLAKDLAKAVKKALGIKSPSQVFKSIGQYTIEGLEIGLADVSGVKRGMTNLADVMTGSFNAPQLSAVAAASGTGGNVTINVNVPPTADKAAIGREVHSALDAYYRKGGRRIA